MISGDIMVRSHPENSWNGQSWALPSFSMVLKLFYNIQGAMRCSDMSTIIVLTDFAINNTMAAVGCLMAILCSTSIHNTLKMGKNGSGHHALRYTNLFITSKEQWDAIICLVFLFWPILHYKWPLPLWGVLMLSYGSHTFIILLKWVKLGLVIFT